MAKYELEEVPPEYLMTGQLMQIAGIMNLLGGMMGTAVGFLVCVGTYGCCFPFMFLGLPAMIMGVAELQWGMLASKGRPVPNLKGKSLWGLFASILLMVSTTMIGLPGLILEIIIQTKLAQREVSDFLDEADD